MDSIKHCNRCGEDKPETKEFYYFRNGKAVARCKACRQAEANAYYAENREEVIAKAAARRGPPSRARHDAVVPPEILDTLPTDPKERVRETARLRRLLQPDVHRERDRRKRNANLEKNRARERLYRAANLERCRAALRESAARRRATPEGMLSGRITTYIAESLKSRGLRKRRSKLDILDWKIDDLKLHLESLFEDGMSWENRSEWQIDHIVPLAAFSFDSEDHPAFKAAWALSNLAPLWASDNHAKRDRLDWQLPDTYKNPLLREMYDNRNYSLAAAA